MVSGQSPDPAKRRIDVAAAIGYGICAVAILSLPSVPFFVYTLAVIRGGATAAVLNWRQPHETNELLMRDLDVKTLIFDRTFKKAAHEAQKKVPGLKTMQVESVCATPLFSELLRARSPLTAAPDRGRRCGRSCRPSR